MRSSFCDLGRERWTPDLTQLFEFLPQLLQSLFCNWNLLRRCLFHVQVPLSTRQARTMAREAPRHHAPFRLQSLHLECAFDLDCDIARQRPHADGRPRMPPGLPEHFDEQVRAAIDHLWLVDEIGH